MANQDQHDAAARLWDAIAVAHADLRCDRERLGKLFFDLRNLLSDRNSGGNRLTSGHGTFQAEIKKRGFKPRRVREWINDHEVRIGLRPPAESEDSKRHARWQRSAKRTASGLDLPFFNAAHPVCRFALLLPLSALKAAYRVAMQEAHPDHGGSTARAQELIAAWKAVEEAELPQRTDATHTAETSTVN
jgi:hypothetical protein